MATFETDAEFSKRYAEAVTRGAEALRTEPHARAIVFDRERRSFALTLTSGAILVFSPEQVPELAGASLEDLLDVEVLGVGSGISWPRLDADVSVEGLVMSLTWGDGWQQTIRRKVYQETGRLKSEAGRAASRLNGKKGGRPRKAAP